MKRGFELILKKLLSLIVAVVMFLSFTVGAHAQAIAKPVTILLGDEAFVFENDQPFVEKSTTLVPMEAFLEQLGFEVTWTDKTKTLTAIHEFAEVSMTLNNPIVTINEAQFELAIAPKQINKTLYVPLRFFAEAFGFTVDWNGQTNTVTLSVEESEAFFWKVEKEGNVVYLLGSIHAANDTMYPMRSLIEKSFIESNHLVVEVDVTKQVDEALTTKIQGFMMYTDGSKLSDHISAKSYSDIQEILAKFELSPNIFDPYKPWQVANEISMLKAALDGYESGLGIDLYYLMKANELQKSILELESFELQLGMFDNFSKEQQQKMIDEAIVGFYSEESSIEPLADLWVNGDDEALIEMTNALQEQEEFYTKVVKDRNIEMVKKIEGYLNSKEPSSYFVIAGYLHMLGDHGVVTLLQDKGYKVTRE